MITESADEPALELPDARRRIALLGPGPVLGTLLLVLLLVGLTASRPGFRQQLMIREIERSGGIVTTQFNGPGWLEGRIPDAMGGDSVTGFEQVVEVHVGGGQLTDAMLTRLSRQERLVYLTLYDTQIRDARLENLKALTKLEGLKLTRCPNITGKGLEILKGMTGLRELWLEDCPNIGDGGLEHLRGMTQLQDLVLKGSPRISDEGLKHLSHLTSLKSLNLWRCDRISDEGLEHLEGLPRLRDLQLSSCGNLTDGSLKLLKRLTNLDFLLLGDYVLGTDAAVTHLKEMTNLQELWILNCPGITDAVMRELQMSLPNCDIELLNFTD